MEFVRGFLLFITVIVFQIDGLLGQDNPIFLPEDIQSLLTFNSGILLFKKKRAFHFLGS